MSNKKGFFKKKKKEKERTSSSKLKRSSFFTAFMGPQKEKKRNLRGLLNPPKCMLPGICALNRSHQKKLSLWHNHCFLSHKQQNAQEGGKKKDLFLYKCNFVPCLCTSFVLWAVIYGKAYSTRQSRFTLREVGLWHLGNRRLFFAISSPSLQDGNVFSLLLSIFKKKKKKIEFHRLLCVVLWCSFMDRKKEKLIKKK